MFRIWILLTVLFGIAYGAAVAHAENIPPAIQLTAAEVEEAVAHELVARGAGDRLQAQLVGGKAETYYEGTANVEPRITGVVFDKNSSRWTANLIVAEGEKILSAHPLSGRYTEMVSLPVLKRQIRAGELITEADLDQQDFPFSRTRSDVVTDAAKLVGNTPRTGISPKRPIREQEIASPAVIKKNDVVSMRYLSGSMEITTTGIALTDGAKGDVIELRNANSKATVRAVVQDSRTAHVLNPSAKRELAGDIYVTLQ